MTAIDTVPAHTLEEGDTIRFIDEDGSDYGLQTIRFIEDDGYGLTITSEQGEEMLTDYDTPYYIYDYTD